MSETIEEATEQPEVKPVDPATHAWESLGLHALFPPENRIRIALESYGVATVGEAYRQMLPDDEGHSMAFGLSPADRMMLVDTINTLGKGDPRFVPVPREAAPPKPNWDEYDAETSRLVFQRERVVSSLEAIWTNKHSAASAAKKDFEEARDELRSFIREREVDKSQPTLFGPHPKSASQLDAVATVIPGDLWQQYPLTAERWERFGLTSKDVEKLNSGETKHHGTHPMLLLGDVTRFITPDPSNPSYSRTLKDVKGMGDSAYDRWTEAETRFWAWWQGGGELEFAREKGVAVDETLEGTANQSAGSRDPEPAAGGPGDSGDDQPAQGYADPEDGSKSPDGKRKRKAKAK
jgi:hypothetical protein